MHATKLLWLPAVGAARKLRRLLLIVGVRMLLLRQMGRVRMHRVVMKMLLLLHLMVLVRMLLHRRELLHAWAIPGLLLHCGGKVARPRLMRRRKLWQTSL